MIILQIYILGIFLSIMNAYLIDQTANNILFKYYREEGQSVKHLVYPTIGFFLTILVSWYSFYHVYHFINSVKPEDKDEISLKKRY